jgi:hypothetical protein
MSKTKIEIYPNSLIQVSKMLNERDEQLKPYINIVKDINETERKQFYQGKEEMKDIIDLFLSNLLNLDAYLVELDTYLIDSLHINDMTGENIEYLQQDMPRGLTEKGWKKYYEDLTDKQYKKLTGGALSEDGRFKLKNEIKDLEELLSDKRGFDANTIIEMERELSNLLAQERQDLLERAQSKNERKDEYQQREDKPIRYPTLTEDSRFRLKKEIKNYREYLSNPALGDEQRARIEKEFGVLLERERLDDLGRAQNKSEPKVESEPKVKSEFKFDTVPRYVRQARDLDNTNNYNFLLVLLTKIYQEMNSLNLFYKSKILKKYRQFNLFDLEKVKTEIEKMVKLWASISYKLNDIQVSLRKNLKTIVDKINNIVMEFYKNMKLSVPTKQSTQLSSDDYHRSLSDELTK